MKGIILGILVSASFLSACTPAGKPFHVHTLDSGKVTFSHVMAKKTAAGIRVSGDVRQNVNAMKNVQIPGHIHIVLRNRLNLPVHRVMARTHRKYGNSNVWHFDGTVKTSLLKPAGEKHASVLVMYHGRH